MEKDSKIFVAGHRGLVGSAILNNLRGKGYTNFLLRTHAELDLTDQAAVNEFFAAERPDYVFLSAAHVGGIMANSLYRADFIYNNLMIQNNVIHASWKNNVKKLLFLGSTCIYPREAPQPMPEDCLLTSPLEYSNEPYAIAKIAGIKMCESYNLQYGTNYIAVMPTNLYGPNDNFNLETSHVLPAMIRKIHLAKCLHTGDWEALRKDMDIRPVEGVSGKASEPEILSVLDKQGIRPGEVELWGTGKPLREFLWSEEMADASVYIMEHVDFEDGFIESLHALLDLDRMAPTQGMQLAYIRQLTKRTVRLGRVKPQLALEPDLSPDQFGDLTDRKLDTRTYINMCIRSFVSRPACGKP